MSSMDWLPARHAAELDVAILAQTIISIRNTAPIVRFEIARPVIPGSGQLKFERFSGHSLNMRTHSERLGH